MRSPTLGIGFIASSMLLSACGGGAVGEEPDPTPATPSGSAASAVLIWTAPPGTVAGYRVYYGTASRTYQQARGEGVLVVDTNWAISDLRRGTTYYFAVTAVDGDQESDYSNEASKSFP